MDAANTLVRVLHAIPNGPNVDICFDPDGDVTTDDLVEVAIDVPFGTMTDYYMSADALVDPDDTDDLNPSFRIIAHQDAANCVVAAEIFALTIPTNAEIQAAFGPDGAGFPIVTDEYAVGSVHTIFAEGNLLSTDPADSPAFVPIIDLPETP